MQEIQDMLNRMDYLATQSANGTYQNEVDRENLQAEVDQLREEINRIASSANFNGIKLLDGSLDKGVDCTQYTSEIAQQVADNVNAVVGSGTIVHSTSLPQQETKFNVDFGNSVYTLTGDANKTVTLKVGDLDLSVTEADLKTADGTAANAGDQISAENIVKAFVTKYGENGASKGDVKFNGQVFKLAGAGNQLTFTQAAKPKTDAEVVDGAMKVTITGVTGGGAAGGTDPAPIDTTPKVGNVNPGDATTRAAADVELTFDPDKVQTITVGGNVFQINPNPAKGAAMAAAATFTGTGTANDPFTVTRTADMTDEDIVAGIAAQLANGVTISGMKFNVAAEGTTLKFEAAAAGAVQIDGQDATEETFTAAVKAAVTSETKAPEGGEKPAGSLNVTANVGSDGKAKAEVDLSTELGKIPADPTQTKTVTLGGKTYVWGTGASTNNNEVDLSIADNAITAEAVKNAIKDKILDDAGTAYSSATAAWEGDKLILTNKAAGTGTWTTKVADVTPTETVAGGNATAGTAAATVGPDNLKAGDTLNVGDKTLNITEEHLADATALANAIKALNPTNFTVNAAADTTAGTVAITLTEKAGKEGTNNADALKGALGVTPAAPKNENGGSAGAAFAAAVPAAATDAPGTTADYNASTEVIQQGAGPGSNRLASTYMDITEVKDGSALKVGDKTYIFAVGKDSTVKASGANQVVVDMKNWTGKEADFVDNALKKLTETAEADGNAMFSVAYQGNGRLTFTEQETYQATAGGNAVDLSTRDAIAKQFGYAVDGLKTGGTLKLQIGDTSDKFNQMDVSVGDMHTSAMGTKGGQSIADIDIGTQAGAAEAVDVIKNAINYVSSVRGTLGATQNRLEHTANNLSVMAENIQDAESSIRDTDIAEEMMAYTKNSILVQSAQAMLAQANQVPQGVLQLLG